MTDIVRTMSTPARHRYPTDSEVRRIKVGGIYGDDGRRTRSGQMLAALIDMAYLTGQRIADLLALECSAFGAEGITFRPAKTRGSTGVAVLIEWTPRLRDVERRLRELRQDRRAFGPVVFTRQAAKKGAARAGEPYTYSGAISAWKRACVRAGVLGLHFHDLRAKALTDTEEMAGLQAARRKGAHSTEQQTSDSVRHRKPQKSKATR